MDYTEYTKTLMLCGDDMEIVTVLIPTDAQTQVGVDIKKEGYINNSAVCLPVRKMQGVISTAFHLQTENLI